MPDAEPAGARSRLLQLLSEHLGVPTSALDLDASFFRLGLDSVAAVALSQRLSVAVGRPLPPTLLWEHPSPARLAAFLDDPGAAPAAASRPTSSSAGSSAGPIALVGLSARMPGGVQDAASLWRFLLEGGDGIREVPPDRWDLTRWYDPDPAAPGRFSVKHAGFLDAVDGFDERFFEMSPREAAQVDPQQRLALELAWEALDDAGVPPRSLSGERVGVYMGGVWLDYRELAAASPEHIGQHAGPGQAMDLLASRISYTLGLMGPSLAVSTACSSSLVAVQLAAEALARGEVRLALAGGVNLLLSPAIHVALTRLGALAPDGRSKSFSAAADGFGRGEGGGVVVLARLADALRDGMRVYAVIRGGAVNNDGPSNGLTAPNPAAQEAVLREAWAGLNLDHVGYVEAHGTGTPLGDPIELRALARVFTEGRPPEAAPLRVGTIKTNVGHLEAAAGVAGLMKTALALHHRRVPGSLHTEPPSPHLSREALRIEVPSSPQPWRGPAFAGVSSFGWGGTNCHIALAGPPGAGVSLRLHDGAEREAVIEGPDGPERHRAPRPPRPARVAWVFSPSGGNWRGMGLALATDPVAGALLRRCDAGLSARLGWSILDALVAAPLREPDPGVDQPLLACIQMAMGARLCAWGLEPDLIVGHSIGEVAAAFTAGILTLDDTLTCLAHYCTLQRRTIADTGMAVVELDADATAALLDSRDATIAAYNGLHSTVISGRPADLDALVALVRARGGFAARVAERTAAHTDHITPIVAPMAEALAGLRPRPARLRMVSSLTGLPLRGPECDGAYWAQNLRRPVRFIQAALAEEPPPDRWVEIGPHPVLARALAESLTSCGRPTPVLSAGRRDTPEDRTLAELGANLWLAGAGRAPTAPTSPARPELLVLSAADPDALRAQALGLSERLSALLAPEITDVAPDLVAPQLSDIARTLATQRSPLGVRAAVVGTPADLPRALSALAEGPPAPASTHTGAPGPGVAFVFAGLGGHWEGMAAGLAGEPAFDEAILACEEAFSPWVSWSLRAVLRDGVRAAQTRMDVAQPLGFAMQVALAAVLARRGVRPAAVAGHSMGEVAAAFVAGRLSLTDAARVICARSARVVVAPPGGMAAIELPEAEILRLAAEIDPALGSALGPNPGGTIGIAAVNGPRSCVVWGADGALDVLVARAEAHGAFARRLQVTYASHSPAMDTLMPALEADLAGVGLQAHGATPFFSTVTGARYDGPLDAAYWARHLRAPVRMLDAVRALSAEGFRAFVEVNPHPVLSTALVDTLPADALVLPSLLRDEGLAPLLRAVGALWTAGLPVELAAAWPDGGPPARLPPYPWQRRRHWLPAPAPVTLPPDLPGRRVGLAGVPGRIAWETVLDLAADPWLRDHQLGDTVLLPAAAMLLLAEAVARRELGGAVEITGFTLEEPMVFSPGVAREVQTTWAPSGPGGALTLHSRAQGAPDWVRHAAGHAALRAENPETGLSEAVRPPEVGLTSSAAFYEQLRAIGYAWGPSFRRVTRLGGGAAGQLAELSVLPPLVGLALHPGLLDAALQAGLAGIQAEDHGLWVPARIGSFALFDPVPHDGLRAWATPAAAGPGERVVDVHLLANGRPLARLGGLTLRRLDRAAAPPPAAGETIPLFSPSYVASPHTGEARPGRWCLIDVSPPDRLSGRLSDRLSEHLRATGATVLRVNEPGEAPLDPTDPAALEALLVGRAADVTGVIVLGGPPPITEDPVALFAAVRRELDVLAALVVATGVRSSRTMPRLVVLTRGALPLGGPISPAAAPLAGLAAVLPYEHPELRTVRVDLPADLPGDLPAALPTGPADADLAALAVELTLPPRDEALAFRGGLRLVGQLTPAAPLPPPRPLPGDRRFGLPFRLTLTREGGLDVEARPLRPRAPGPGEVVVAVHAAGLNFFDVVGALGLVRGLRAPGATLGVELAGVVTAVGEGVGLNVGDAVIGLCEGALASEVTVPAVRLARLPAGLDMVEGASVPAIYTTAWLALGWLARVAPGERVLVHAAAGGTGQAALQVLRALGGVAYATAGSPSKRAWLQEQGVAGVYDSRNADFAAPLLRDTGGEGVDVVLNSLAGPGLEESLRALGPDGRLIELGKRDIYDDRPLGLEPFRRRLGYHAVDVLGLAAERPARFARLLDEVVAGVEAGRWSPVPITRFSARDASDALQQLARGSHRGKLVVDLTSGPAQLVRGPGDPPLWARGTWLITGGLGGLGLGLAAWLLGQGVARVVLVGRRGETPEIAPLIAELRRVGGTDREVVVLAADVSRPDALARVLDTIDRDGPPLRGVVHAAMVLDDGLVRAWSSDRAAAVLAPKLLGAWNLHLATRDRALDAFVLYASLAGTLGSPGQGAYMAANSFLDALAHARAAAGLPALAIDWGVFAEVGAAAARADRGDRLAARGLGTIHPDEGLSTLGALLDAGPTQVTAARIDIRQWREFHPQVAGSSWLAGLAAPTRAGPDSRTGPDTHDPLLSAPPAERRAHLEAVVTEALAAVLRVPAHQLDPRAPFKSLGVDSLLGLELRNRLESRFAVTLPATLIWRHPHVAAVATFLDQALQPAEPAPPVPDVAAAPAAPGSATPVSGTPVSATPPADVLAVPAPPDPAPASDPSLEPALAPLEPDSELDALSDDALMARLLAHLGPL